VIAAPNRRVREVLQLTKLDSILKLYDNVDVAVKAMK
jgi:anti-anti-sigma regulatory factor